MAKSVIHGAGLTPYGIYLLAEAYQQSADVLMSAPDRRRRFSENPIWLLYLQAMEGYLRCSLRLQGANPAEIRSFMHDIAGMLERSGLAVSTKTANFIKVVGGDGDYVRVRYDLDLRHLGVETFPPRAKRKKLSDLIAATADIRALVAQALESAGIEFISGTGVKLRK